MTRLGDRVFRTYRTPERALTAHWDKQAYHPPPPPPPRKQSTELAERSLARGTQINSCVCSVYSVVCVPTYYTRVATL